MKIAYFDLPSGISGDMTLGALVDVGIKLSDLQKGIDSLGLPSCRLVAREVKKKGFRATSINIEHEPEHAHRHLHHITEMIDAADAITPAQKDLAKSIFTRLGEAEAKVHGTTLRKVHFHEVGAVDSIADIVGSAIGLDLLGVEQVVCSAVPTGSGFIEIAHGRVSIPAPATAELLTGIPLAPSSVQSELTTPTGAAIVATIAQRFGPLPAMSIEKIGYGAGDRDLEEQANLMRLILGNTDAKGQESDQVWMMQTNLDDISGEFIGHCTSLLIDAGALDVYTTAVQMKKNRPAVVLTVLSEEVNIEKLEHIIFRETSTLGVRRWLVNRHKLSRRVHQVTTPWGTIEGKIALHYSGKLLSRDELQEGIETFSPEYESCRKIALENNLALAEVYQAALNAFALSKEKN